MRIVGERKRRERVGGTETQDEWDRGAEGMREGEGDADLVVKVIGSTVVTMVLSIVALKSYLKELWLQQ